MERHLEDRDRVGVQDAVLLEDYTSEDAFVENLQKRSQEGIIYTYIGQVLISVNPYKELNIYDSAHVNAYTKKHFFEVPPHVFAITDTAFRSLLEDQREQCILISGESGSGKTEASKKVLQYIAEITEHRGEVEKVKNKLLQSNPVLEAFGNATTNRNDNSSRFGKYMDIQFSFEGSPTGGAILNYLLEKSRVISQVHGERNFHIFYQLLRGASDTELNNFHLERNLNSYAYLSNGSKESGFKINDKKAFAEVKEALSVVDFKSNEQNDIFRIVAAILHLGNVNFKEVEGLVKVATTDQLQIVSKMLGCSKEDLQKALTYRTIETKLDVVTSPLSKELAVYARDALAKAIYDRLFNWLVKRINTSLQPSSERYYAVIGILDIYGFEIFENNSFEQLCINFCNEKLQQLFIDLTLRSEQEEYLKEGIEWQNVEYFDNKLICELIEEKHKGLIAFMDEECLRPGDPDDKTLLEKFNKELGYHKHFISHPKADTKLQKIMKRNEFQIIHYAGEVTYNITGFIEKNNDLLFRDLRETMSNSTNDIVKSVFPAEEQRSKKLPITVMTHFKNSLNNLMKILRNKEPSYIRCIKPNDEKRPDVFDKVLVSHQVKYLGLMENLRVRRAGFAYRRVYEKFLQRYKSLSKKTWPNYPGSAKDGVQELICSLGYEADEYKMGKTKIFIRYPKTLFRTEDAFQEKKHEIAAIIQARWKGIVQRKKFLEMRKNVIIIQQYIRRYLAKKALERRKKAATTIRKFVKGFITRNDSEIDDNKEFLQIARASWLRRLAKNLPKNVLDKSWPPCPQHCNRASDLLHSLHSVNLRTVYRRGLTPERKAQLELKVLAETLFKDKKKSYEGSVVELFTRDRLPESEFAAKMSYVLALNGEKEMYVSPVMKYDRHGYKPRERIILITTENLHVLELNRGSVKLKHLWPLTKLSLIVTSEKDKLLLIGIPQDLIEKDKGDLILEVPHLVEAITYIIDLTKNQNMLTIIDQNTIEHTMKEGKKGTIDVVVGSPQTIHKEKNGHLLIIASP